MGRRRVVVPLLSGVLTLSVVSLVWAQGPTQVPLSPNKIPKFAQELPQLAGLPGMPANGIQVIYPTASNDPALGKVLAPYTLSICEFQTTILPPGSLGKKTPAPLTWVWGYRKDTCPQSSTADSYIGPVVVATHGYQTRVTYINQLGNANSTNVQAYKFATDQTLMWADPLGEPLYPPGVPEEHDCADAVAAGGALPDWCYLSYSGPIPAAPHLHGGEIPAGVDGGPDAWWTANDGTTDPLYGHGYYSTGGEKDAKNGEATYIYTNTQESAPIWFHDHVLGATRLNVYAGIAGAYYIVDPQPGNFNYPADPKLPTVSDVVPLVIQDRMFDTTGQLYFPAAGINPLEHPFWIPELVGDVIVVNGKAWPFMNVEPKKYRFLFLNGSNARAYELYLNNIDAGVKGPSLFVIGTDQGYLDTAVELNPGDMGGLVKPQKLAIMPGERYEVIVDFSGFAPGTRLRLQNDAKTPYPDGAPPTRGTGQIMEFRVLAAATNPSTWAVTDPVRVAANINRLVLSDGVTSTVNPPVTVTKIRRLTLNEAMGPGGPLEVLVNNTKYRGDVVLTGGAVRDDFMPISTRWNTSYYSEIPYEGETEMWEIVNLTADAHPIHPHLVAFQLLNREGFDVRGYDAAYNAAFPGGGIDPMTGTAYLPGVYMPGFGPPWDYNTSQDPLGPLSRCPDPGPKAPAPPGTLPAGCYLGGNPDPAPFLSGVKVPPLPSEYGWKDTVIAYPGQITRFLVRFAPTTVSPLNTNGHYEFDPNGGHGYVWHCHIIDHEDNEMMRPMSVVAKPDVGERFSLP